MAQTTRFRSLDALRGLAILGMAWSGMLPDSLPAWMYHAQIPPPNHDYSPDVFGITWVDLIFPLFLFSMGAAIPIAISNRLKKGASLPSIVLWLAGRALLLASFAIFSQHLRPYAWATDPGIGNWLLSILGFGLLVVMYGARAEWAKSRIFWVLRAFAWIAAIVLVATHVFPDDGLHGFANYRNDVILMVLANVAFSGGLIWLFTRGRPSLRYVAIAAVALIFLSQSVPESAAAQIWNFAPHQLFTFHGLNQSRFFPIFYHFEYHKYLLIVLPGTFCGDLVLRALGSSAEAPLWPKWRSASVALLGVLASVIACVGLFSRATVATFWTELVVCGSLVWLTRKSRGASENVIAGLVRTGAPFLMLGLLAEPIGGGIRKDSTTLSYFLVTAGLAFLTLAALQIAEDGFRESGLLRFASETGMNPMLAYAAITNFVMGLSGFMGYSSRLGAGVLAAQPWALAVLDGGLKTMLVGLVACAFTRARYFLRT